MSDEQEPSRIHEITGLEAFTPEVVQALDTLRDAGFAVAAFTPDELRGANPRYVEDLMVERGHWAIEDLVTQQPPWPWRKP